MTLNTLITNLLNEGYSGNQIQKLIPSYGFKKRRQDLQALIRELRGVKKKLTSNLWEGLPQTQTKPRSKLEKWKRAVSTASRYENIFHNFYVTFFVSWTDEIGFFHEQFFTKFLGLMTFKRFRQNRDKLIEKVKWEIIEDLTQGENYEDKQALEIHTIDLIEIFRHKDGVLRS